MDNSIRENPEDKVQEYINEILISWEEEGHSIKELHDQSKKFFKYCKLFYYLHERSIELLDCITDEEDKDLVFNLKKNPEEASMESKLVNI